MPGVDSSIVGVALVVNVVLLFGLAFWVRGRITTSEDYLVAGRQLGVPLAAATLFATWFGAGTLLVATDEVRNEGLRAAALDPIAQGSACCSAGMFFAVPLWRMKLITLVDFYRVRFGPRAETLGALLMVPGYFGWIAAQFVALALLLELFFGIDPALGLLIVATVGAGYTLIGGMWSVVVTDALQSALLVIGLVVIAAAALLALGNGDVTTGGLRLLEETPPDRLALVPHENIESVLGWLAVLAAGALGNLPGQDLMQRIFASRSATVARRACLVAGLAYLVLGAIPVGLGLTAALLAPDDERAILPILAGLLLHPVGAVVFVLAIVSAVLSTIDQRDPRARWRHRREPVAAAAAAPRLAPRARSDLRVGGGARESGCRLSGRGRVDAARDRIRGRARFASGSARHGSRVVARPRAGGARRDDGWNGLVARTSPDRLGVVRRTVAARRHGLGPARRSIVRGLRARRLSGRQP